MDFYETQMELGKGYYQKVLLAHIIIRTLYQDMGTTQAAYTLMLRTAMT